MAQAEIVDTLTAMGATVGENEREIMVEDTDFPFPSMWPEEVTEGTVVILPDGRAHVVARDETGVENGWQVIDLRGAA